MSTIRENISEQLKDAMRSKQAVKLSALRSLIASIQNAEKAEKPGGSFGDAEITKIIVKAAAQRRESIALYTEQNRPELAGKEAAELTFIEELLPKQMTHDELVTAVLLHILDNSYSGKGAMREAMSTFSAKFAGQFDPKAVGPLFMKILTQDA